MPQPENPQPSGSIYERHDFVSKLKPRKGKFAIVEDDDSILRIQGRVFSGRGYTVHGFIPGENRPVSNLELRSFAREVVKTGVPVALVDLSMEMMSGIEFCAELREQGVAVILHTGSNLDHWEDWADEYILKLSADSDELLERIKKYLPEK